MDQSKAINTPDSPIDARYRDYVNGVLLQRFRVMCFVVGFFYLAFNVVDRFAYPSYAGLFLKIRCAVTICALIFFLILSFLKAKNHALLLINIFMTIVTIGIAAMIYVADGSASRYYDGANLVFLATGIMNTFYYENNAWLLLSWLGIFEFAMLGNGKPFDPLNFCYANAFMFTTGFLVVLMTKFYREQSYKAFVREEQLANLYQKVDKLAKTDELTAIHNRRHFFEMLERKIDASEISKAPFYLVIFDVDHFKEFNDKYGHAFGDTVLVEAIKVVKGNVRANDFIGRYGGDEFIIYLDFSNYDAVMARLTKISYGVKNLKLKQNTEDVSISVSIGAAKFKPEQNITAEKLLELADAELFNVKNTSRGQIRIAD